MGGAFRESGNVTAAAEFNIWHDPEAAEIVCRAFSQDGAAPAILVGLDVTRRCVLTEADLDTLAQSLRRRAERPGADRLPARRRPLSISS